METYEYIFAALILVAMLIAASFLASITPQLYRSTSEIDQLKMAAQKIMVEILLNPGNPPDWGKSITLRAEDISSFGLATYTEFTRNTYILDPDKVQRLSNELPSHLYVHPARVLGLLNLGLDYGIKIDFIPALKIDISSLVEGQGNIEIDVSVFSEQGVPAANAAVIASLYYVYNREIALSEWFGLTDSSGRCAISLRGSSPALLIVLAEYHGIQMVKYMMIGSPLRGFVIGRFLLAQPSNINDEAYQVFVVSFPNGSLRLMHVTCILTPLEYNIGIYRAYNMSFEEPSLVAVIALTKGNEIIAAYKIVPESYGSTAAEVSPPLVSMLERSVKIGTSTYTVRLRVWRASW